MSRTQLVLILVLVVSALSVVTSTQRARQAHHVLEKGGEMVRRLEADHEQLKIEQARWANQTLVSQAARTKLQMQEAVVSRTWFVDSQIDEATRQARETQSMLAHVQSRQAQRQRSSEAVVLAGAGVPGAVVRGIAPLGEVAARAPR